MDDRKRLESLRLQLDPHGELLKLEHERNMLSVEILESILLRLEELTQRMQELEDRVSLRRT